MSYDPDRLKAEAIASKADAEWRAVEMGNQQEKFTAKVGGQEVSVTTSNLNTVATVVTLMIVTGIAVAMYMQSLVARDAKDDFRMITREVVVALKEMTIATREQNCMLAFPPERREANVELCKRMAR